MRKWNLKIWLAAAFFALCAGMTLVYLTAGYGAYLDSDMASELVLAEHLADKGLPVSGEWYYSTEVRLINTQLVFSPLMSIPGLSFRMVRTLGCIILLSLMAALSIYAACALGADAALALIFAGMNISLCSPLYAQNVIIGAYYIPHAALSMALIGLYAGWMRKGGALRAALLAALSMIMGMSSIRYLLSSILPLACAAVWMYVFPDGDQTLRRTGKQNRALALALGAAALGAAGYVLGTRLLPAFFHINLDYYGSTTYANWEIHDLFAQTQTIVHGLLRAMGFEGEVPLFGVQGMINALIILVLLVSLILLVESRRTPGQAQEETVRFGRLMLIFAFCVSAAAFVLLRGVYFDRYWLPVVMIGAPVMAACLSGVRNRALGGAAILLFAGTVLLTSASCAFYSMRSPQVDGELRMEAVNKADELGLEKGYATFWNANILTELTDGRIDVVSLAKGYGPDGEGTLEPYRWLETEADFDMDMPGEPVFLLMERWEEDGLTDFLSRAEAERHEIAGEIQFFVIPSQRLLFEAMNDTTAD